MTNDQRPRKQKGSSDGGQWTAKEHADADIAPLGARAPGGAELGSLNPAGDFTPRNELERAMVRADALAERARSRADTLHRAAVVGRISEAYPDLSSLELDIDEETGTLRVLDGADAAGELYDEDAADAISNVLFDQDGHLGQWREQTELASSSMTGGPATLDIATELENAPVVPEPGSIDSSVARAEDIVDDYLAVHDNGADEQTAARDLLTDMYHLCRQKGWDFDNLTQRAASMGYEEENEPA